MSQSRKDLLSRRRFLGQTGSVALASLLGNTPFKALAAEDSDPIVSAAIYPGIGIARIGNSTAHTGYYIGPEVTDPAPFRAGHMRDAAGAIKRQAARFRIYGTTQSGKVRELTPDFRTDIRWTVHLANKKADWFRFVVAMDIPEAAKLEVPRRNALVEDRSTLIIDPGPRSISGFGRAGSRYRFDSGKFLNTPVSLGELRTDSHGRLLVLSALGKSGSPGEKPQPPYNPADEDTFNNADGWYDDTADGPVSATLTIHGKSIPVESAWVAVAPPNYAPDVISWRTMYDLLLETYYDAGMLTRPTKTFFMRDVVPLFKRLSGLQWVNKGFADMHGKMSPSDFENPEKIAALLDPKKSGVLEETYDKFRLPEKGAVPDKLWPMLYGDAYGTYQDTEREHFIIEGEARRHLENWANGDFENDTANPPPSYRRLAEVPIEEQPHMLTRAALHFCLADAFHPGCELTWPMRRASMYSSPFRIKVRAPGEAEDFGKTLDAKTAKADHGPAGAQGPGGLTRWMAVPWQGDTVFCRSGYDPEYDPYLSTFWPARVPNHVLSEADYQRVMNTSLPREQRLAAFKKREHWVRNMKGGAPAQILQMVAEFGAIGVIETRPGIPNDPDFPPTMQVENLGPAHRPNPETPQSQPRSAPPWSAPLPQTAAQKAGWQDDAQLNEFRRIRMPRRRVPE